MNARHVLRALPLCLLALLSLGPAPGHVGACGEGTSAADPSQFCLEAGAWRCARRRARGEILPEEELGCRNEFMLMCPGSAWPPDCDPPPTERQTDLCIDALSSAGRIGEAEPDLVECQLSTLCGGSASSPLLEADDPPPYDDEEEAP